MLKKSTTNLKLVSPVSLLSKTVLGLIRLYQRFLSFDTGLLKYLFPGGACRFSPTCSEYTYLAIERYGTIRGTYLGVKRFLRCNGLFKGGSDPIPG